MAEVRTRRVSANGLTFAVDEAGDGDRVALLLHGFPESRAAWRRQLPRLAGLGWRAVACDLRGYGDSDRPARKADYGIAHLVNDVVALFDALGASRRLLIGHDWGGVIAWQTALRPAALDGLVVLNAPHPAIFRRVLRGTWRQKLRSWYILFFQLPWLPEALLTRHDGRNLVRLLRRQSGHFPPDLLELYRCNVTRPGAATAMLNYYRANAANLAESGGLSRKITTPTLMIWGEDDQALDVALTENNGEFVEDFTLELLPGVSHWVQHDASDRVNAAIAAWARSRGLIPAP